jgi:HYDIN/CFA65/VesB family protein/papain like protease
MRQWRWSCGSAGALFWLTACSGPIEHSSEAVTEAASTLTSATPAQANRSPAGARGLPRSRKDPSANTHPTGRRELDAKERARAVREARKVIGVRPTQLALDRLRGEGTAPAAKSSGRSLSKLAELEAAVVPFGADLVTAEPASTERQAAASALPTVPRAADNSVLPAFPEIRTQGAIGSCVAFAVGYYQYTYALGRIAGWNNKNAANTSKISPKWLYNLINAGNDNGSSVYSAHAILKEHGALTWSEFPYSGDALDPLNYREWPRTAAAWKSALKYKSLGFAWVDPPSTPEALAQVKSLVANGQVLTFDTYIYSWSFEQLDNDPATSLDDAFLGQQIATWMDGYQGAHEATIVGYNDDLWVDINASGTVDPGEKGAFKVANSWGPNWQNAGYVWIAYDAVRRQSQVPNVPVADSRGAIMSQVWALAGARTNYQPNLLAEFTASTAARSKLILSAGVTEPDRSELLARFEPPAFLYNGGEFAYDGTATTTAKSGGFAVDLSDLALSYGDLKYRLQGQNLAHTATRISGLTLVDGLKGNLRTTTSDRTQTMGENQTKTQSVRYQLQDPAHVPRLALTPTASIAFGDMTLGQSVRRSVTASNTGTGDLLISSLRFSNPLFLARTPETVRLAPGASSELELEFAPAAGQAESATLSVRNTSFDSPTASLTLTGSATSTNDDAPYQLFITQQNDPYDNSAGFRAELKSKVTTSTLLSDYQVVYYLSDPGFDPAGVRWDTVYTNTGPISAIVKPIFFTRDLGVRKATWSVIFRFAPGSTLAAGASAIFQGNLHRPDYNWYPDESDDWSRYLRSNGMAEGAIIQSIATQGVVFGLPAEGVPGAYQLKFAPSVVTTQSEGTASFTVTDPSELFSEFIVRVYSTLGEVQQTWWTYPDALGLQSVPIPMLDQGQWPIKPGKYAVVLESGGSRVDATEFTKQ